jgi:apolipoprotein N-acyltransferase
VGTVQAIDSSPLRWDTEADSRTIPLLQSLFLLVSSGAASVAVAWSWLWPEAYAVSWAGWAMLLWLTTYHSPRQAFAHGFAMGLVSLGIAFHWGRGALDATMDFPAVVDYLLLIVLLAWEAIPFGILCWCGARQLRRHGLLLWVVPLTWVLLESYWPRVFPWSIAHSQTEWLALLQLAEWTGAAGISFCFLAVALVPAALVEYLRRAAANREAGSGLLTYAISALLLQAVVLAWGQQRLHAWHERACQGDPMRVAIVQVDPRQNDSIARMKALTENLGDDLDLVCWPESTLGTYRHDLDGFHDEIQTRAKSVLPRVDPHPAAGLPCELLAGAKGYDAGRGEAGPFYQTSLVVRPDERIIDRYRKRALMPLGEYVPGQQHFPWLRELFGLEEPLRAGEDPRPVTLMGGPRVGVLMCYEDMVASHARDTARAGAQLLVCLLNGSAFPSTLTLEQHLRLAQLRAIENRRYFIRCGATGVSCVIGPTGALEARQPALMESAMVGHVHLLDEQTMFTQYGHRFPVVCAMLLAGCVIMPHRGGSPRRHRPALSAR